MLTLITDTDTNYTSLAISMIDSIGATAGLIWNYLKDQQEPLSLTKLKIQLSITASATHLAIGWLARENKVQIEDREGVIFVSVL